MEDGSALSVRAVVEAYGDQPPPDDDGAFEAELEDLDDALEVAGWLGLPVGAGDWRGSTGTSSTAR